MRNFPLSVAIKLQNARGPLRHHGSRHPRATALVTTLALILLVTIAVMAFFARATSNRTVEASRVHRAQAEQLVLSGVDYVTGAFLREIESHSTVSTIGGYSTYVPLTNTYAVPQRPLASTTLADGDFANLIRQSVNVSTNGVGENKASTHNTASPSKNGRVVGLDRWNAPYLIAGSGFVSTNQLPSWIYLSRDGSTTATPSTNAVGRFAYNVYEVGGLLDANVAGYPGNGFLDASQVLKIKNTLAGVDLSQIPGMTNATTFVKEWRNITSASSALNYLTNVASASTNGFLRAQPGDNRVIGRQDLILYARENGMMEALPYLTSFSRALNSPSYTPPPLETGSPSQDPQKRYPVQTSSLPTYGNDDKFNPSLIDTRVTTAFQRDDGSQAISGEPLINKRFPLSRLALLTLTATAEKDQNDPIYRYFGLYRSSANDPWTYDHGEPDRILKLQVPPGDSSNPLTVQIAGREPDFFELLQAAISVGSLGKAIGDTRALTKNYDEDVYRQIIQIGANLIDQYDADSYPVRIDYDGTVFSGIENLPYITRVFDKYHRRVADPDYVAHWFQPEIWKPHRQVTASPGPGPTVFRFVASGTCTIKVGATPVNPVTGDYYVSPPGTLGISGSGGGLQFTIAAGSSSFTTPSLLTPSNAPTAAGDNRVQESIARFVGLFTTKVECPETIGTGWPTVGGFALYPAMTFFLQYRDSGGGWVTYNQFGPFSDGGIFDGGSNRPAGEDSRPNIFYQGADPRSARFGILSDVMHDYSLSIAGWSYSNMIGRTLRPDSTRVVDENWPSVPYGSALAVSFGAYPGWEPTPAPTNPTYLPSNGGDNRPSLRFGYLPENRRVLANGASSPTYYSDADGVIRMGDAAYASGGYGQPLDTVNAGGLVSRPIVLNRPFRSVADMGYAFRDTPWKSLDFFTANSGDAALLDVFCVDEPSESAVTAGLINLNTRQQPVLQAVLAGSLKDELTASSIMNASEVQRLASKIVETTRATPIVNRSDLSRVVSPALSLSDFSQSPADGAIKGQRESVVRALADVGDTRMWNLLIDVVAQSGRFTEGSTDSNRFLVEGEQRYWVHIAIDRYTGKIVEKSVEVVNE